MRRLAFLAATAAMTATSASAERDFSKVEMKTEALAPGVEVCSDGRTRRAWR